MSVLETSNLELPSKLLFQTQRWASSQNMEFE